MKGKEVAGIYLLLTSLVLLILLAIPDAPQSFALQPLGLGSVLFFVFFPQSVEYLFVGIFLNPVPAWASLVILALDFMAGLGLMLWE